MKEIDKIRIRQWNQDNPYIQMKNLENAQPGYRVHTVNDDHHLYELPLETQNIILDWVFWNFYPAQKIYPHLTSDDLKEVLYKRTQIHLHNNQFKEAIKSNRRSDWSTGTRRRIFTRNRLYGQLVLRTSGRICFTGCLR